MRATYFRTTGAPARALGGKPSPLPSLALVAMLLAACSPNFQFSQLKQFQAIRDSLGSQEPSAAERALIEAHRPEFYLPSGHEGPIDFYRDYISHGELRDGNGALVSESVTSEELNQHKHDPAAVFAHRKPETMNPGPPAVYGGIAKADIPPLGGEYTFLSYHAVFRTSGLPVEIGAWREFFARLLGDRKDWHQLDHYTSVFVALDPGKKPRAVILQQHNYMRTYVIREGGEFKPGEPIKVDVAADSNEIYPHSPSRQLHRAAGFMDSSTVDFLLQLTDDIPFLGSYDVTEGIRKVDYQLEYLPPNDAFYVFQGYLGERRKFPGRDGPPGAIYNTVPALKPLDVMFPVFYWTEKDEEYSRLIRARRGDGKGLDKILPRLRERLAQALKGAQGNP